MRIRHILPVKIYSIYLVLAVCFAACQQPNTTPQTVTAAAVTPRYESYRKVVIIGSSTAKGGGASKYAKSWAGLLIASMPKATFVNLAEDGYTTYHVLPTGYVTPVKNRLPVDTTRNVTKALRLKPDCIIISMPSNDVARGWTVEEVMANFATIIDEIKKQKTDFYILSSMPRSISQARAAGLIRQKEATLQTYGKQAINVYEIMLKEDGEQNLDLYVSDKVHPNDTGHRVLYETISKHIKEN